MADIRKHFILYGSVQGVGFRFRASRYAYRCHLTGWVRNLPDGSVEMELEGERGDIGQLLYDVEQSDYIRITNMISQTIPLQGSTRFEIR